MTEFNHNNGGSDPAGETRPFTLPADERPGAVSDTQIFAPGEVQGYTDPLGAAGYPEDEQPRKAYFDDHADPYPEAAPAWEPEADNENGYDISDDPALQIGDVPPPERTFAPDEDEEKNHKRSIFKKRKRKPSFVLAVIINSLRLLLLIILLVGLSGVGAVIGIAKGYMDSAPELDLAAITDQAQTSFICDRYGNVICEYMGTENRVMVSITTMPQHLQHAFVAVEDARFYSHNGVDVKRIIGAFVTNFTTGSNQGGSTITQQLIKNTLLSNEQSYKRKIQEAYLAMQLENRYTKNEILENYLNTIYLGENYYGVQVASYGYFGKNDLSTLTLRECAMLAGMTQNPYYYNCRRNYYVRTVTDPNEDPNTYRNITDDRTDYVLRCMLENDFITQEEYNAALDRSTAHILQSSPESTELYSYPHYVEYAVRDAVRILLEKNGLENTSSNRVAMENELRTGGYHIFLAIDTEIQEQLENTIYNYSDYPTLRDPDDKIYRTRNSDGTYNEVIQPQVAAVVMDYRTGYVLAMVGSRTRPTARKTLNRCTDMNMPVGSSIKPIAVYAPAIDMGCSPASVTYNLPLPISGWKDDNGRDSWPTNYGGSSYRGPETLRTALKYSDNTAAAWTLLNYVTLDRSVDYLTRMGVNKSHINATPFGVSLGSSGITPLEMAACFSALGNGGVYLEPLTVLGIFKESPGGNVETIAEYSTYQDRTQVFKASTAYMTIDMLKDAVSGGTGTGAKIKGQTVAGKTGTNSDQKGVFFAGLTGWYCGTVWIGHDNYKSLSSKTTGGTAAAKLWNSFMTKIHNVKKLDNKDILSGSASDYNLVKVTTCVVSGQLATDACKYDQMNYGTVTDYWLNGTQPTTYCQLHKSVTVCSDSGKAATPYCPVTSEKGVIILPVGHPLQRFVNTQYSGVLTDYLGDWANLDLEHYSLNSLLASDTCTWHSGYQSQPQYGGGASMNVLNDAYSLLSMGEAQLSVLGPYAPGYSALFNAVSTLSQLLSGSPTDNDLYIAMANLTQAMHNAQ